ncbi:MAG: nucleotide exchange factor GrpE [Anaerolineales bacterium]|nr:MAG: nucleotide exchange factor GrpE [Anaerolineales bacterium]
MTKRKKKSDDQKPPVEEQELLTTEQAKLDQEVSEEPLEQVPSDEIEAIEKNFEELQSEIGALRAQTDEYLDGWQRSRAEFANYKKRVKREKEEMRAQVTGEILTHYLGVIDDLERALKDRPVESESNAWAEGIELIFTKLKAILESEGVEPIVAEGKIFDPNFHEAVTYEENDDHRDGEVIEVIQTGYKLGDRVLRPAMVRVAK